MLFDRMHSNEVIKTAFHQFSLRETYLFFLHLFNLFVSKTFLQEIRSQAAAIVASVDFLGNPMGLINDVSSGLHGLVKSGNVGGLFLNVAHGVSDSAAKVSTHFF